jgi:hypothetical protein
MVTRYWASPIDGIFLVKLQADCLLSSLRLFGTCVPIVLSSQAVSIWVSSPLEGGFVVVVLSESDLSVCKIL